MFVALAELPVFDQQRARAFYTEKLGCAVVADAPMSTSAWRWIEVGITDAQTALHFVRRQNEAPSEGPVLVFIVDDLRSTVRELVSKGVTIVKDIGPAPYKAPNRVSPGIQDQPIGRQATVLTKPHLVASPGILEQRQNRPACRS